ncbi:MAG: metallophosphoesterase [Clostridia bacterium]
MLERKLIPYAIHTGKLSHAVKLAVVSDLHDEPFEDLFPMMEGADALLVPGDVANRYLQATRNGVRFLAEAAKRLPTFYSVGNHETKLTQYRALMKEIKQTGAEVLINRYVRFGELWIGGWYLPQIVGVPDMLEAFEQLEGCKVLLCHKPNHYMDYVRERDIDLVVAGHAHGGQIRMGQQGLYAPGQGFFPKYTRGVVDGRMVISAGVSNPSHFPRWGNPCEMLMITLD